MLENFSTEFNFSGIIMKKILLLVASFTLLFGAAYAGADNDFVPYYKYRIWLKDKGSKVERQLRHPEKFLSERALERRARQGVGVDATDVPVNPKYIAEIESEGLSVILRSKWNNTIVVQCEDTTLLQRIECLPFVKKVEQVAQYRKPVDYYVKERASTPLPAAENPKGKDFYGRGQGHINKLNGVALHDAGYRGKGVVIAVLDGGFNNQDRIDFVSGERILGTKNYVAPDVSVYDMKADHGLTVASCMMANEPNVMVGTAPEAAYWLMVTEDNTSEQPVEEDYWAAAVEFADSVGVDIVNSSLGYESFGEPRVAIPSWERDGRTHLASRSASMMAAKGMILCNGAGNSGEGILTTIVVPADSDNVLAVGAVAKMVDGDRNKKSETALDKDTDVLFFSSRGGSYDGRIKPDVLSEALNGVGNDGKVQFKVGTSFSTPVLCGMVACLWQALPNLTAFEIMDIIRRSGSKADDPNNIWGYGVPDFQKALQMGKELE